MIIVSDTTPVISLLKAQHLELLQELFGDVIIPEAVFCELTSNLAFEAEVKEIKDCHFIKVARVEDKKAVNIFRKVSGLDAGESEAIVMAEERNADLLLIDERKGRRVAKQRGVTITGTIGILMHAYDEELLSANEVEECLSKMRGCGIRISNTLYDMVLNHMQEG